MYRGINTAIIVGTMTDAQLHDIEGQVPSVSGTIHLAAANGDPSKDSHVPFFLRGKVARRVAEMCGQLVQAEGAIDARPPRFTLRISRILPLAS
jgi:hypothetical protein